VGGVVTAVDVSDSPRLREIPDSATPDYESTVGERMLAGTISDYHGPLFRGDDKYNGTGDESAQAVARAHVYRILSDRSYHDLQLHLERCDYIRDTLGLVGVPHRTTFAHSWREQFSDATKEYIEEWAGWIQEALDRLDVAEVEPYLPPEEPDETEPLPEIPSGEIDESIRHVEDIMLGTVDFDRGPNTTFDTSEILDAYTNAARERVELNAVLDEDEDDRHSMSLKTLLNSVKNRDSSEWQELFEGVNDRLLSAAKGAGMLDRPVEVYGDITVIPYYPQNLDRPAKARGNEKKAGTYHGFHFATLVAHDVAHDKDFIVAKTPYTPDKSPKSVIQELVSQAREHVSIKRMYLDSEFRGARLSSWLDGQGFEFVTRLPRSGKQLKGLLASMTGKHESAGDYAITSADKKSTFRGRLIAEPDWNNATEEVLQRQVTGDQHTISDFSDNTATESMDISDIPKKLWTCRRPYITNVEDESAEELLTGYNYRWRVENQYADVKRALLGKTQSRHHSMRVFFFWLSCLLYNAWMVTRAFLRLDRPDHAPRDRPPVSARKFVQKILRTEHG
jgi:hypothetical protein